MKRRTLVQAASAALALGLQHQAGASVVVGQPAPPLQLPGLNGTVDLATWRGQVVYLDFWASWCGPCRQSFPFMNDLQSRLGPAGLQVLAVNVDSKRADAERFLAQTPARFTLAFDHQGETPRRFEVKAMPSSLVIGRDGGIRHLHRGFRDEDRAALEHELALALAAR